MMAFPAYKMMALKAPPCTQHPGTALAAHKYTHTHR